MNKTRKKNINLHFVTCKVKIGLLQTSAVKIPKSAMACVSLMEEVWLFLRWASRQTKQPEGKGIGKRCDQKPDGHSGRAPEIMCKDRKTSRGTTSSNGHVWFPLDMMMFRIQAKQFNPLVHLVSYSMSPSGAFFFSFFSFCKHSPREKLTSGRSTVPESPDQSKVEVLSVFLEVSPIFTQDLWRSSSNPLLWILFLSKYPISNQVNLP